MAGVRNTQTKAVGMAPQAERIPLLPGNNFHDDPINRATLRKSHGLGMNTVQDDFVPPTEYSATKHPKDAVPKKQPSAKEISERWAPKDECLRFLGFFREAVSESAVESQRLRKCCLSYYPQDGTLLIREGRMPNSGMMNSVHSGGAVLVRRHKVYDADGDHVDVEDLQIGEEFECYGKVFKILDCDGWTRNQLTKMGWVVPEALPWPEEEDLHAKAQKKRSTVVGIRQLCSEDMDVKRQMEFAISGRCSKVHPEQARAAKQFLATDRGASHLTYSLLWDDRGESKRECRLMALKYYLEDDTMEIAENRIINSGRDSAVKFLCRQRLQKPGGKIPDMNTGEVQHGTFGILLKRDFFTWKDLTIGKTIQVHQKEFLLYDADHHTRQYCEKQGAPLEEPLDIVHIIKEVAAAHPDPAEVKHFPPPHDGYGDEEDSLGNWRSLMLKAPKKDYDKLLRDGHKVLRFRATLQTRAPEDQGREFVVNFYMATNEVEVLEHSVRNSGIIAGKFLAKRKLYRDVKETGQRVVMGMEWFTSGQVVPILGRQFLLGELDEKSRKYMDGVEDEPQPERIRLLIGGLKDLLNSRYQKSTEAFRAISSKGVIGVSDIMRFFEINNQPVKRREAKTVLSYFDVRGEGCLTYNAFVNLMEYKNSQNMDESSNMPRAFNVDKVLGDDDDNHDSADRQIADKVLYKKLVRALRDRLEQRSMKQQEIYRIMAGQKGSSLLDKKEFEYGLRNILHMQLSAVELGVMVDALFGDLEEITFPQFSTFLEGVGEFLH